MDNIINANYNAILSLGPACRPAYHIQKNNLRLFASPLDWVGFYSLETAAHLFETKFEDFFSEIELKEPPMTIFHKSVQDVKNNILSPHHFKNDVDLKTMQAEFRKTMLNRANRIDEYLKKSEAVAFLCNRDEPQENFKNFLFRFQKLYPHLKLTLYNVINADIENMEIKNIYFEAGQKYVEIKFRDVNKLGNNPQKNKNFWLGNEEKYAQILDKIAIETVAIQPKNIKIK